MPASTYRLQFHKGFTFRDAAAIVPYLAKLGVTHCYASPYLRANMSLYVSQSISGNRGPFAASQRIA